MQVSLKLDIAKMSENNYLLFFWVPYVFLLVDISSLIYFILLYLGKICIQGASNSGFIYPILSCKDTKLSQEWFIIVTQFWLRN